MDAPTSFLPSIKRLDEFLAPQLHDILTRLVTLYLPEVRGTAPIDENLETLQADTFERSFTIRWLTGFIARGEEWVESYTHGSEDTHDPTSPSTSTSSVGRFQTSFAHDTYQARATAFDRAAALLGACAGTSASGAISREFKFPTSGDEEVAITLRDESISTGDHTAVGLQTWGSACILAERIARDPPSFGIPTLACGAQKTRILELGAGTGLLSLLFGKLAKQDQCTIVATDYHPAVLDNLRANVQANFQTTEPPIQVEALDWSLYLTGKPTTNLSRAPSTAVTPAIGTPIAIDPTPLTLSSAPSLVSSSTLSTPGTPRTPQTPRTVRSPPPNLARAVFSRLIARGEEFDMPGTEPGEEVGVKGPSEHIKILNEQIRNPEVISARPRSTVNPEPTNYAPAFSPPIVQSPCLDPAVPSSSSVPVPVPQDQAAKITPEPGVLLCADGARRQCLIPLPDDTHCSEPSGDQHLPRCLDLSNKLAFLDNLDADGTHAVQAPQLNGSARIFLNSDSDVKDKATNELVELCPAPTICSDLMTSAGLTSTRLEGESGSTANKALGSNGELAPEKSENLIESSLIDRNLISQIPAFEETQGRDKLTTMSTPFDRPFDTIFGADIVYELSHVNLVRGVVERLLRKPSYSSSTPPAFFHLIMPLRPTHADEASSVDMAFPRAEDVRGYPGASGTEVLAIVATETYARSAGVGRADEVQYVHYKVGWV